ncbi:tripartite motif-containing protein 16-like [Megalobrama amblycephala]|uniref:tripartite motif-containing protein 16-like n=1 Tax=Megalobrama amblycephala TaxID=75352 RepID=UPI00201445FE|nr:tripartite motif-containing protein 16-like [Megalobrama amblycephala]XP_048011659.1 tripartite motif-containing protein 16-like [Megalobrama amblycephala]XP_048011660.1 tripartite motif-containing protein 16-like [Megalobrama amblycephala]XP_048011661.1 tripartite motif-containing protein 16-like [Megalobrama amblycephala]XP_048011662.1 tripartite motif-containing protein 16-like [Megalobrama amblycephala]XP_048011663.1 tripartite motif-containing protein 16-like [Megalobrama amblycephala]
MMASISDHLLDALDDLDTDELKRFKWRLKNHKGFSRTALQKADAPDTVDLMMKCFGPEEAVRVMVDILRKMNQNHVAEQLEKKHKQAQAEGSIEDPALVGANSKPIEVIFTNIVPRTRNDFLQYSHRLTLDLNTANKRLCLSENNRVITNANTDQPYPDHPDRFDHWDQVLCRESVCDRCCYWEIEWSGRVYISVSYKSISRKGGGIECVFGRNDQSWCLYCYSSSYSFRHNNIETELPVVSSRRIGVYVDHSAGTLSFYNVSGDTMSLIHTVQTTFTQPLYPGFTVYKGLVKLC